MSLTIYLLVGILVAMKDSTVYHKVLDVAEELIQKHGFHAFSYKDISLQVGIKTSSIHYHFPTKNDLANMVIERHMTLVKEQLDSLSTQAIAPKVKMKTVLEVICSMTFDNERRMCLGGMLAIGALMLDESIIKKVQVFFEMLELHVAAILIESKANNSLMIGTDPKELARIIIAMMEGVLVLSRLFNKKQRIKEVQFFVEKLFA